MASVEIEVSGAKEFADLMRRADTSVQQQVHLGLQMLGEEIKADARRMCPVRTGRLRRSIYSMVKDWILKVGAWAPYAKYVEFGTRYIKPFYFLTEAIHLHLPRLRQIVLYAVHRGIQEAAGRG